MKYVMVLSEGVKARRRQRPWNANAVVILAFVLFLALVSFVNSAQGRRFLKRLQI